MKTIIVILALLLAGCATTRSIERDNLDNRITSIIEIMTILEAGDKEVNEALYQRLYAEKRVDDESIAVALLFAGCTSESVERDDIASIIETMDIYKADKEVMEALNQWLSAEGDQNIAIADQRLKEAENRALARARERTKPKLPRIFIGFGNFGNLSNNSFSGYPYKSSSGHQYKYDLSNPGDEIRYNLDIGAKIKDSTNPAVNIDNGLNPCHTYRGIE